MDIILENNGLIISVILYIAIILFNISSIKKTANVGEVSSWTILAVAIMIPALPFAVIIMTLFALYRTFVQIILKYKYGPHFAGLVSGTDAIHFIDEKAGRIVVCCIVRSKRLNSEEFFEKTTKVFRECLACPRLNLVFPKAFGYFYKLKHAVDINKFVVKMKTVGNGKEKITKEQFSDLLSYYYNVNDEVPFLGIIGTQRLEWKDNYYNYFPVIFKCHHGVGDGVSLLNLFIFLLAKSNKKVVEANANASTTEPSRKDEISTFSKLYNRMKNIFEILKMSIEICLLIPRSTLMFFVYKSNDNNILHGPPLSYEKLLGFDVEDNEKYVKKIKEIKKEFPGITFPTVLLTAFSASFNEYFEKNCYHPPKSITAAIPVVPGSSILTALNPETTDIKDIEVKNIYTMFFMNLPINIDGNTSSSKQRSLVNRLKLLNKEIDLLKYSYEYQTNRLLLRTLGTALPYPLIRLLMKTVRCTTCISVISGPKNITYADNLLEIVDIIPWVPHFYNIHATCCSLTYDDRLQMGFVVDKALISDQKGIKAIIEGVYKYLDILCEEISS